MFHSIDSYVEVLSSAGETVPWYSTKILRRRLFFRSLNHGPVRKASGGQFYCTRVLQWAWSGMPPLLSFCKMGGGWRGGTGVKGSSCSSRQKKRYDIIRYPPSHFLLLSISSTKPSWLWRVERWSCYHSKQREPYYPEKDELTLLPYYCLSCAKPSCYYPQKERGEAKNGLPLP